ncbi:DUF4426 domain-containing protein [Echinimonas agarilytica]|uniref:DUF4426 domain-containing protein n=1 Tax=Echinimonas agarilytica TaxID=1215918 RepID=A0AA42B6L1_9GAMM|nr:DUF4426 domain-containing protein [Echinimonas agarilytica]MCM2678907.1 DUF4426 domain-containing protein [Echinimonas agarilytica]
MKAFKLIIAAVMGFMIWLPNASAEMKKVGPYEVHFSAFESTFLTPEIAKTYQINRSRYHAVINVSILDTRNANAAIKTPLTGEAKNLLGHNVTLSFKEIIEGNAVYYIDQLKYSNEETFRFYLVIKTDEGEYPVQFIKKFYVN